MFLLMAVSWGFRALWVPEALPIILPAAVDLYCCFLLATGVNRTGEIDYGEDWCAAAAAVTIWMPNSSAISFSIVLICALSSKVRFSCINVFTLLHTKGKLSSL